MYMTANVVNAECICMYMYMNMYEHKNNIMNTAPFPTHSPPRVPVHHSQVRLVGVELQQLRWAGLPVHKDLVGELTA